MAVVLLPYQKPPSEPWSDWMIGGPRAWGKTRAAMEEATNWVRRGVRTIALIAINEGVSRRELIEGPCGFASISDVPFVVKPIAGGQRVEFSNGVTALLIGAEHHRRLEAYRIDAAVIEQIDSFDLGDIHGVDRSLNEAMRFAVDPKRIYTFYDLPPWRASRLTGQGVRLSLGSKSDENDHLPPEFARRVMADERR